MFQWLGLVPLLSCDLSSRWDPVPTCSDASSIGLGVGEALADVEDTEERAANSCFRGDYVHLCSRESGLGHWDPESPARVKALRVNLGKVKFKQTIPIKRRDKRRTNVAELHAHVIALMRLTLHKHACAIVLLLYARHALRSLNRHLQP